MEFVYFEHIGNDGRLRGHLVPREQVHIRELDALETLNITKALANSEPLPGDPSRRRALNVDHYPPSAKARLELASDRGTKAYYLPVSLPEAIASLAASTRPIGIINGNPEVATEPVPERQYPQRNRRQAEPPRDVA